MAESNCEDRLVEAAIFSVMITGSHSFLVDSDADAKTSLFSRVLRGGKCGRGGGGGKGDLC